MNPISAAVRRFDLRTGFLSKLGPSRATSIPSNRTTPAGKSGAGLRLPHLVALLIIAHAPLTLLWAVVPRALLAGQVVATPLIFLLAGLILLGYVVGYSGLGRRIRHPGGLYAHVTYGLGRTVGLGTAALVFAAYLVFVAGIYGLLGLFLQQAVENALGIEVSLQITVLLGIAVIIAASQLRFRVIVWICTIVAVEELVAVLGFDLFALQKPATGRISFEALDPGWLLSGSFAVALVFSVTAFIGSELGGSYSTELKDPERSVPKATLLAYGITALLLVVSAWAVSVTVGAEEAPSEALAQGDGFMPGLVLRLSGDERILGLLLLNLMVGIVVAALTLTHANARQLAGLAHDGVLPRSFAMRHADTGPPRHALFVQPVASGVLAYAGTYAKDGIIPQWLLTGAGLAIIGALALASAATASWYLRCEDDAGGFFGWEGQAIAGVTSVVTSGGLVLYGVIRIRDVAPGAPPMASWLLGALLAVIFLIGAVGARVLQARKPAAYHTMGRHSADRRVSVGRPTKPY